jgi:hypothetical protein
VAVLGVIPSTLPSVVEMKFCAKDTMAAVKPTFAIFSPIVSQ